MKLKQMLTAKAVDSLSKPGKYGDQHGLMLLVAKGRSKSWVWRGTIKGTGRRVDRGLGAWPYTTLAEARKLAFLYRKRARQGLEPSGKSNAPWFSQVMEKVIAQHRPTWKKGGGTEAQWRREFGQYVLPHIGLKQVDRIETADVAAILTRDQLWTDKNHVAMRLKQRIGTVMKWAIRQGHRVDNPADAATQGLPKQNGKVKHHDSLPHQIVGQYLAMVRASGTQPGTKLALEFIALTAARTGEARLATWDEVDLKGKVWTIPPERMKTGNEHCVPLSSRAVKILQEAGQRFTRQGLIFPGKTGKPMSHSNLNGAMQRLIKPHGMKGTVHGLRSSFSTWCQGNRGGLGSL